MAYRPSFRRTYAGSSAEPDLTPIMNLMVVLIPLLLTSAEFIKIGIIELNLPPAAGPVQTSLQQPQEKKLTLDLTVSITERGFYVSSALAVLRGQQGEPTIPLLPDGSYDFDGLSQKLLEIKEKAAEKYPDLENVIIQAEPNLHYQILVSTMDAARSIHKDEHRIILFPQVSLSAGIINKA